jgi:hypothetical protein
MLRIGLVAMAGIAALAAAPSAMAAPSVKVTACQTGSTPEARLATFEGKMSAVKGTARMAMRFQLIEVTPGNASAHAIPDPKLSQWRRSNKGVKQFTYDQTVNGLHSGVTYVSLVHFRWFDAKGKVIKRAQQRSGKCVQDGDLPNLVLTSVSSSPGETPGTALYTIAVNNSGQGDSPAFEVTLIVDGKVADSRRVDGLQAGDGTTLKVTGPSCSRLRAVVDRGGTVSETVKDDNELRSRC